MRRQILATLLSLSLALWAVPATAFAQTPSGGVDSIQADSSWYVESASELSIYDTADFMAFHNAVNSGTDFSGKTVTLEADLDFGNASLSPVGLHNITSAGAFKGVFDGKGHSISNVSIVNADSQFGNFTGLFGIVSGAKVQNLSVTAVSVTSTPSYNSGTLHHAAAVLAGNASNSVIENCSVSDCAVSVKPIPSESGIYGLTAAAGLVGRAYQGSNNKPYISNCQVAGTEISGNSCVGGAIGVRYGVFPISAYSSCNVTLSSKGSAGSFIGASPSGTGLVKDSLAAETTIKGGSQAGGLAGAAASFSAEDCYVQVKFVDDGNEGNGVAAGYIAGDAGGSSFTRVYVNNDYSERSAGSKYAAAYMTANTSQVAGEQSYAMSTYSSCGYVANDPGLDAVKLPDGIGGLTAPTITALAPIAMAYGGTDSSLQGLLQDGLSATSLDESVLKIEGGVLAAAGTGTTEVRFSATINGKSIEVARVSASVSSKVINVTLNGKTGSSSETYGGTPKTIAVSETNLPSDLNLVYSYKAEGADYSSAAPVNAGTYTVKVESGNPNYELAGTTTATLTINPAILSGATVTSRQNVFPYTGSAITPDVAVTLDGKTLIKDTDYAIAYSNNTEPGTASIEVTGKGNYTGTATGSFEISSIAPDVTAENSSVTYNGRVQSITVSTSSGNVSYYSDSEMQTEFAGATNVGAYTVYYKVTDAVGYKGEVTGSVTLTINSAPLTIAVDDKDIYVGQALPSYTYKVTGWQGSDEGSVKLTGLTFACNTDGKAVGSFSIDASGADAGPNYAITYVPGTLTVSSWPYTPPAPKPDPEEPAAPEAPAAGESVVVGDGSAAGATVTVTAPADEFGQGGTVAFAAPAGSQDKDVTIPETVEAGGVTYTVTEVADGAFAGNTSLESVTLPSTVTAIGAFAFDGCTSLEKVAIPGSAASIGQRAFAYTAITSAVIPAGVEMGTGVFRGCTELAKVTVEKGAASIEGYTFKGCTSLKSVTISSSVTKIGRSAFSGCTKLGAVTVPAKVASIGKNAFYKAKTTKLTVSSKKLTKASVKGCLSGSNVKTIKVAVSSSKKVNKSYAAKYLKLFAKSNSGKSVKLTY